MAVQERPSEKALNNPATMWRKRSARVLACIVMAAGLFMPAAVRADAETIWKAHVEPLLKQHCTECHNPNKTKSGLDLSTLQTMLRGGDRGPAVIPGKPEESQLFKSLHPDADPHMPPGSRKKLSDEEAGLIAQWIKELPLAKSGATAEAHPEPEAPKQTAKRRITWTPESNMPPSRAVDRFLELAWKLDGVTPAKVADDATFARRLYLDVVGRIPSTSELEGFVKDRRPDKREQLVETLLASDEYARHMREVFDTVLMNRPQPKFADRRESEKWHAYLDDVFRRNRRWDEVVRELIVARPQGTSDRGAVWFLYERENNPQAMAEAIAPVVWGVQIKCAQCHDHMVAREIKQAHYWGTVAAFNRSKNVDTPRGPALAESAIGGFVSFANLKKESQPALLTFFGDKRVDEARPKDGEKEVDSPELYVTPPVTSTETNAAPKRKRDRPAKVEQAPVPKFSRRVAFAEAVTKENPLLARAMVNRIWAMLFGRGIVHPVDLMDSKHAPAHPELLDWLAQDFEASGYDVKRLVRTLCNTRAYQLEARPVKANGKPAQPETFARVLDKPLSAEQLYRSLLIATANAPGSDGKVAERSEKELRQAFVKQFPDLFPAEYNATLQQAMFFSNSSLFDALLAPRDGNLAARLMAMTSNEARVRGAYAAVFGREPDREELRECAAYLAKRSPEAGVKQLLWAMLTSAEFQVNH
jgi:mono/diheme cytochrome c family protein